jgi:hypothetical protein
MGIAFNNIPREYDLAFISAATGINFDGRVEHENHTRVTYMDPDGTRFDIVSQAIENYEVDYLPVHRPTRIAEVRKIRDEKIGSFTFGGMPIELDLETKVNITGAVSGLERNPDVLGLDWSLGDGEFVFLDRATMFGLADAAFLHVQACFTHAKDLVASLKAATTCSEIDAVDVTVGWPGDEVVV